jgi:BirA family biotin operon repressor/biotin-[acetyl-CoA-carboxylase] ligase
MFIKEKIENIFKGDIIGKEIIFFESIASTNDKAMETGMQREDPEGTVIIADTQTHGRGRFGRNWTSPPGVNLYFTVILKPPLPPAETQMITLATATAVASAIREHTGLDTGIKWPNDILVNGRKTGGILTEMRSHGNSISLLTVGIGVNVNMPLSSLPEDIRHLSTSLKTEKGGPVDREKLLKKILAELERAYKNLLNGNKRALINEWLGLNSIIGNNVRVQMQDRVISGTAEGISDMGELVIRLPSGKTETVSAGEVTILKD